MPLGAGRLALVEAKSTRTADPRAAESVVRLASAIPGGADGYLVHRHHASDLAGDALRPGVRAVGVEDLVRRLTGR